MKDQINVLDKGFVRIENFAGGDQSVVRAARVSYASNLTTRIFTPEEQAAKDMKLIKYMLEHEHGTPFEHNMFTFHVKAPIFVFRQWHRTRIGVSYNELSARYSEMNDEFYIPKLWREQDTKNKQGSKFSDKIDHDAATKTLEKQCHSAMATYDWMIREGIAREMARMVLPVNLYSEMYVTFNARSLMNFIGLRSEMHAQSETRKFSHAMSILFKNAMPMTHGAMTEVLEAKHGNGRDYSELFQSHLAADAGIIGG